MRMRKNKQENKQTNEQTYTVFYVKHCDEGKRRAKACSKNKTATKENHGRLCPIQSEIWHIPFSGQAMPCHDKQCQVKPKPIQRLYRARPSKARPYHDQLIEIYLYQMTFMLHPFHFLLSTCRVTSIISSIPVDFAQYSHGYWYTLIHSYTLSLTNTYQT